MQTIVKLLGTIYFHIKKMFFNYGISNDLEQNLLSIEISKHDVNIIRNYAENNSQRFNTVKDIVLKKFLIESSDFDKNEGKEMDIYHDARLSKKTKMFLRTITGLANHFDNFAVDEGHLKAIFFTSPKETKQEFKIMMKKFWQNKLISGEFHQLIKNELKNYDNKDSLLRFCCKFQLFSKNIARYFFKKKNTCSPFYKRNKRASQENRKNSFDDHRAKLTRLNLMEIDYVENFEKENFEREIGTNIFLFSNKIGSNRPGDFKMKHLVLKKYDNLLNYDERYMNNKIDEALSSNIEDCKLDCHDYYEMVCTDRVKRFDHEKLTTKYDCDFIEYYGGYPTKIEYFLDVLYESKKNNLMLSKFSLINLTEKHKFDVDKFKIIFENLHEYFFSSFEKTNFKIEKLNLLKVFLEDYVNSCNYFLHIRKCERSFYYNDDSFDENIECNGNSGKNIIDSNNSIIKVSSFERGLRNFLTKYKKFLHSNQLSYLNFIKFHYTVFKKKIFGVYLETIDETSDKFEVHNFSNDSGYFENSFESNQTNIEEEMWD